jgi:hypothetical protein
MVERPRSGAEASPSVLATSFRVELCNHLEKGIRDLERKKAVWSWDYQLNDEENRSNDQHKLANCLQFP